VWTLAQNWILSWSVEIYRERHMVEFTPTKRSKFIHICNFKSWIREAFASGLWFWDCSEKLTFTGSFGPLHNILTWRSFSFHFIRVNYFSLFFFFFCCLMTLSVSRINNVINGMINKYIAAWGIRIGRGKQSAARTRYLWQKKCGSTSASVFVNLWCIRQSLCIATTVNSRAALVVLVP
jgi:hypothetical protein